MADPGEDECQKPECVENRRKFNETKNALFNILEFILSPRHHQPTRNQPAHGQLNIYEDVTRLPSPEVAGSQPTPPGFRDFIACMLSTSESISPVLAAAMSCSSPGNIVPPQYEMGNALGEIPSCSETPKLHDIYNTTTCGTTAGP